VVEGKPYLSLVRTKTRVVPLKQVLPRLELCAAILLSRLAIRAILALDFVPTHLWMDSTVTLGWIRGHPTKGTIGVANRVAEI